MKEPDQLPSMTVWQAYKQNKIANKFYKASNIKQRFVAEVLDRARLDEKEKEYLKAMTLHNESFMISDLSNDKNPAEILFGRTDNLLQGQKKRLEEALQRTSAMDKVWNDHYKPLYYAVAYTNSLSKDNDALAKEIKRLEDENLLTDTVVERALASQANVLSQYMKEMYGIDVAIESITTDEMINIFKQNIKSLASKDNDYIKYMLSSLYEANPTLLQSFYPKFEKDSKMQAGGMDAKNKLKKALYTERKMILHVWKEAAEKTILKQNNPENKTSSPKMKK